MKDAPANQPDRKIEKGGVGTKARAALAALYILAAGLPGITLPSKSKADGYGSYDAPIAYTDTNDMDTYSTDAYTPDPKWEEMRKERQMMLNKELGKKPMELKKKMQELLALGPQCREKVDRSMLSRTPGVKETYDKLINLFSEYDAYMGSLEDGYRQTTPPINPEPPISDGYDYSFGSYDYSTIDENPADTLRRFREMEVSIERQINEILGNENAPELMKLLLEDAACAVASLDQLKTTT